MFEFGSGRKGGSEFTLTGRELDIELLCDELIAIR